MKHVRRASALRIAPHSTDGNGNAQQLAALTNDLKAARSANQGAAQAQEQLATSRGRIAELEARVRDMSSMQDTQRSALEAAYAKAEEMDKLHQAQARRLFCLRLYLMRLK